MATNSFTCDCNTIHTEVVENVKEHMLEADEFDRLTNLYKTLSSTTRLKILYALVKHPMCVCDLSNLLCMTKSAVSHQLKFLRDAKLVKFKKENRTVYYYPDDDHVKIIIDFGVEHIREEKDNDQEF